MNHRRTKEWIEQYVEHTTAPEITSEIERHLEECPACREQVQLTRLTREIVRASRLQDECEPPPHFVHSVLAAVGEQKETSLFWSPVRLLAMRAIPVLALLAFVLAAVAYTQLVPALSALSSEPSYAESYLEPSPTWEQERLMFDVAARQDSERAFSSPREQHSDPSGSGRQP